MVCGAAPSLFFILRTPNYSSLLFFCCLNASHSAVCSTSTYCFSQAYDLAGSLGACPRSVRSRGCWSAGADSPPRYPFLPHTHTAGACRGEMGAKRCHFSLAASLTWFLSGESSSTGRGRRAEKPVAFFPLGVHTKQTSSWRFCLIRRRRVGKVGRNEAPSYFLGEQITIFFGASPSGSS